MTWACCSWHFVDYPISSTALELVCRDIMHICMSLGLIGLRGFEKASDILKDLNHTIICMTA